MPLCHISRRKGKCLSNKEVEQFFSECLELPPFLLCKDGIAPHDPGERVKGGGISFGVCMGSMLESLAVTTDHSFSSDLSRTVPVVWPPINAV